MLPSPAAKGVLLYGYDRSNAPPMGRPFQLLGLFVFAYADAFNSDPVHHR
jgi:hypothetical protein